MFERIWRMLIKEFIQVLRDPRTRFVILGLPVIQTILFGYAVTTDVRNVRTAVLDRDNSPASRELVSRFVASGYFRIVAPVGDEGEAAELIDRGQAVAFVRIDHGFGDELRAGRSAPLQLVVDGTDSNTAHIVLDYSSRIVEAFSQKVLATTLTRLRGQFGRPSPDGVGIDLQTRAWFNENLASRNFYVPGVIALLVTLVTLLLTSMSVVREKESGTMEQVVVTPIRPAEFILGKTVPFALIGFVDVIAVTLVAVFWFDVPIRGRLTVLLLGTTVYLASSLGLGLLISTVSRTQQQAMMTTFFFFMPAVLLSGFVFPIANMPTAVQWLTWLNPLRYFLVIIRGVFLKGVGLDILWPQVAALAAMGTATLAFASTRFHKTMG